MQINLFLKKVKVFTFENLCDNLTFLVFNSRLADNFGLTFRFQITILKNRNPCFKLLIHEARFGERSRPLLSTILADGPFGDNNYPIPD